MSMITLKEDGEVYTLDEKNQEILNNLEPVLKIQVDKKNANMYLKKPMPLKFGSVITNKLLELLRTYGLLKEEILLDITADDLRDNYLHFMALVNKISEDIEITPTKPLFCAYMGITTKIFNKLEKSGDDEVKRWVDAINGDFTHSIFDSSLHGNASEKTALAFASTKEYGQETVQNDFNATITTKQEIPLTPEQALAATKNIFALIENAKSEKMSKKRN